MAEPDVLEVGGGERPSELDQMRARVTGARKHNRVLWIVIVVLLALLAAVCAVAVRAVFRAQSARVQLETVALKNAELEQRSASLQESLAKARGVAEQLTPVQPAATPSDWWERRPQTGPLTELYALCGRSGDPASVVEAAACYEEVRRASSRDAMAKECESQEVDEVQGDACWWVGKLDEPLSSSADAVTVHERNTKLLLFYSGRGCRPDAPKYPPACNQAATLSFKLGKAYRERGDSEAALAMDVNGWTYHHQGCRLGLMRSCEQLAYGYTHGRPGLDTDGRVAEAFAIAACGAGDAHGCRRLGYLLERERRKAYTEPDTWARGEALRRACELDSAFCTAPDE